MRRVVSLFLPHWSTDRLRRTSARPQPDSAASAAPLVTAIADHGRRLVAVTDKAARQQGIVPGMTVMKARSLVPALDVVDANPQADLDALRKLALWAGRRYSPIVAPDPPDGLFLDITGCAPLFDTERALVKDLHRRVSGFGLSVQLAVADTAGCAHAVARHVPAGRPVTIEPGDHRKALALLPVRALRLEAGIVEGLRKLGFERIEQLIGAPRAPFVKRFGKTLYQRLDQAMGHAPEPIEPLFPEAVPRARRELLEPIVTADAFAHVLKDLATDIAGQLNGLGKGARRLDCYFHRVDGHTPAIRIGTATPTRDGRHMAKLLCARIETIDPGLGIEAMTLIASLADPLTAQQHRGLADREPAAPDIAVLVDALANRFGQRQLYRVAARESVMPERSTQPVAALAPLKGLAWDAQLPRPSRMLARPEPVQVTAMLPDHPPAMFIWRGKRYRVAQADGPERLHGEWWRGAGHEADQTHSVRDYFQVETSTGARYWLFRLGDGENPATGPMTWFLHGAFA